MMLDLKMGCVDERKKKRKLSPSWKPSIDGSLVFNVDGASNDKVDNCPEDCPVFIKNDSKQAVSWVDGLDGVINVKLLDSILEIREILSRIRLKVGVHFVPISSNAAVDFLAKKGAANGLVQVAWAV
ncbi:hypothetical protein QYF36_013263 [Acer negundo]|nr:hypothetical protein QYF36_013263 [Acer negundo]